MSKPSVFQRFRAATRVFRASGEWRPQTLGELDKWMEAAMQGGPSASGASVTSETAMAFAAFFSGVLQISQTVASCDTRLYRVNRDESFEPWKSHPLYRLLMLKPNKRTSAFRWKEVMQHHAIVWGNGFSFLDKDGAGRPRALWLMNPSRMRVEIEEDGSLVYLFNHQTAGEQRYTQDQIFHVPGFGFNGVTGFSSIRIHRDAIGLGLSQQEFTGRFIENGTHLGGILSHPKTVGEEAQKRLKESWRDKYGGAGKAGTPAVLEEGMTYTPLGMPLADAQFLESKIFQIQEISRILNISPYKLKDYSRATFNNVEHLGIEYATDTIRPWTERWEAEINSQLLSETEQLTAYCEFDLDAIHRGDMKTMNDAFVQARHGGWMNGNEIRRRTGLNRIEGPAGEAYWMPMNMLDANNPGSRVVSRREAPNE